MSISACLYRHVSNSVNMDITFMDVLMSIAVTGITTKSSCTTKAQKLYYTYWQLWTLTNMDVNCYGHLCLCLELQKG
jgi:hypothetical protein